MQVFPDSGNLDLALRLTVSHVMHGMRLPLLLLLLHSAWSRDLALYGTFYSSDTGFIGLDRLLPPTILELLTLQGPQQARAELTDQPNRS